MIASVLVLALVFLRQTPERADEARYYTVEHLALPAGERLEVGGLDFLPDGRLALSTRRGQVWLVENALDPDPSAARFTLFAEGLQEGLGLAVVEGELLVLQRSELSRLVDLDGDGRCDRIDTLASGWGNSGHYHEFAFGLPRDREQNLYVTLNVSFGDPEWWLGRSTVPWRGWALKIAPDGTWSPFCSGLRSAAGLGVDLEGRILATDNQGDWVASCPLYWLREGSFHGHPASLAWSEEYARAGRRPSDSIPPEVPRAEAALWIPYDWSRSAGALAADASEGAFGPFGGQLFIAEMTNGYLLRAKLEEVEGVLQGAVWPFRRGVGSAVRVAFAPDGTLFAGLTARGWGGQAPESGLARVRWSGELPMEVLDVRVRADGFELSFTRPLAPGAEPAPERCRLEEYRYDYWWEYGSPIRERRELAVERVELTPDRRGARLIVPELRAGRVVRLALEGVGGEDGWPLVHQELAYTVNRLPGRPAPAEPVARAVTPPPPRESDAEGTLRLTRGPLESLFEGQGFVERDVRLAPDDPTRLIERERAPERPAPEAWSERVFVGSAEDGPAELRTRFELGDADLSFRFLATRGSRARLELLGRYALELGEGPAGAELSPAHLGGLPPSAAGAEGRAPLFDAWRGPGEWHWAGVRYQAPRFDPLGRKLAPARLQRILIDDVLLQDELVLEGPSAGASFAEELVRGPLVLRVERGALAITDLSVRPRAPEPEHAWEPLFDGESLAGFSRHGEARWTVEGGILRGEGPAGYLLSEREDLQELVLRAELRINAGGNSGLFARASEGHPWPAGYELQVNSTHADPARTGSFWGLAPLLCQLVPPDTWARLELGILDGPDGARLEARVNGVLVNRFVDPERRHLGGRVALQQHHEGSTIELRRLELRRPRAR